MCHAAAECLELQCFQEYWSETEQDYTATSLHRLRPEERANLSIQKLHGCKNFSSLLLSERNLNQFFKTKLIQNDIILH